jgi:hypothetical protein
MVLYVTQIKGAAGIFATLRHLAVVTDDHSQQGTVTRGIGEGEIRH